MSVNRRPWQAAPRTPTLGTQKTLITQKALSGQLQLQSFSTRTTTLTARFDTRSLCIMNFRGYFSQGPGQWLRSAITRSSRSVPTTSVAINTFADKDIVRQWLKTIALPAQVKDPRCCKFCHSRRCRCCSHSLEVSLHQSMSAYQRLMFFQRTKGHDKTYV